MDHLHVRRTVCLNAHTKVKEHGILWAGPADLTVPVEPFFIFLHHIAPCGLRPAKEELDHLLFCCIPLIFRCIILACISR